MDDGVMLLGKGEPAAVAQRRGRLGMWAFVVLILCLVVAGVFYRHWAWDYTDPGRYRFDINRNYLFGTQALDGGYLNLYENQVRDNPPYALKIDYPPLRLATFMAWAKWTRWTDPKAQYWRADFDFNAFLIHYNTFMGLMAAAAAFLVIRHWLRVCAQSKLGDAGQISPWTGVWRATVAFALVWFDPGIAIIGHGWPSPNLWVVPIYLWAVYFCLRERWFVAGLVIGVGTMMQGQQLVVAGAFVLWPLLAGRPQYALRWVAGFVLAFGLIVSGWMLTWRPDIHAPTRIINWSAVFWVASVVALPALLGLRGRVRGMGAWWFTVPAAAAVLVIAWPCLKLGTTPAGIAVLVAVAIVALFWWSAWRMRRYLLALLAGAALLSCMFFWRGSTSWWYIGFLYGAERFPHMYASGMVNNLSALLSPMFGWYNVHELACELPRWATLWIAAEPVAVTVRQVMTAIYGAALFLAAALMAWHWHRKSGALLVALVLPWMLFYTLLPQMSPRYAVFVAGVSALLVGRSIFLIPAVWLFSLLTVTQTALCMIYGNNLDGTADDHLLFSTTARSLYESQHPTMAWAVVITAGVVFLVALIGRKNRSKDADSGTGPMPSHPGSHS